MKALPPGTILQLSYLEERLKRIRPGRFIEIGPGSGEITALLLELGWSGYVFDIEATTISTLKDRFLIEIESGKLTAAHGDFIKEPLSQKADLIISAMVIEHLNDNDELAFMAKASTVLTASGLMIGLVPSSPRYWGIEDEIAGHFRRYTRSSVRSLTEKSGWRIIHLTGLTYPLSNILFPISNLLVKRSESHKLQLSKLKQTQLSGQRNVPFKTSFPSILTVLLNKHALTPLHWLQKFFSNAQDALVLYFEASFDHTNHSPHA